MTLRVGNICWHRINGYILSRTSRSICSAWWLDCDILSHRTKNGQSDCRSDSFALLCFNIGKTRDDHRSLSILRDHICRRSFDIFVRELSECRGIIQMIFEYFLFDTINWIPF
jgi:hypothetical protein